MVSQLMNVDTGLAQTVAAGLRLRDVPKAAPAARPVRTDLKPSRALSMLANPPGTFRGRKAGIVVTDGADGRVLRSVQAALKAEGATFEIIAPNVGGVEASDGTWIEAQQKLDGAPSVVYDAVVVLASDEAALTPALEAAMRDFLRDAFAHLKVVGYGSGSEPLLERAGITAGPGFVKLAGSKDAGAFVKACRDLRVWQREGPRF